MIKIYRAYLDSLNFYKYCLAASLLTFTVSLIVGFSYRYMVDGLNLFLTKPFLALPHKPFQEFISDTILVPLLETMFFQSIIISILQRLRIRTNWILAITTLIFAASHLRNSTLSALNTIFLGFVLNYSYLYWLKRSTSRRIAFESSLLIHSTHNFYCYLLMFVHY